MTKQADFKRRVRARMAKTGESYATARSRLLAGHPGDSPLEWMPGAAARQQRRRHRRAGTGLARRVVYWRDILHEGPVPEVPPAALRRIRAGYLTGGHSAGRAEIMRQFTERDQALQDGRDGQYVLWFEADLYDQLRMAEILPRLADLGVPAGRVTLICIGEHAGGGGGQVGPESCGPASRLASSASMAASCVRITTPIWEYGGDSPRLIARSRLMSRSSPVVHRVTSGSRIACLE